MTEREKRDTYTGVVDAVYFRIGLVYFPRHPHDHYFTYVDATVYVMSLGLLFFPLGSRCKI